ncbi:Ig-like domain-containing protein [Phytoactinopolyspora halotolerans]|uniref:Bacterial Ig-like domain-containing protein n=1 Tax=Phytoactinopolyspora halotolerans TaxID=1981512 RepID=A0A6L9SAY6_9ACTN|nr:Ig-like domain-containing protein [Phytoactinopolyspora halotolerans]NEE02525.1 hypothetical protein [Phytoactinopolyspora halotolerans]
MSGVAVSRCMLAVCVSVAGAPLAAATVNAAEEVAQAPEADVTMAEFEPDDFADQAAELPGGLMEAIERDLDTTAERYLAQAATAHVADDVIDSLGDLVVAAWLDHQTLHVVVESRSDQAAVAATGARVHVGDALTDAQRAAHEQGRVAYIDRTESRVVPVESELISAVRRGSDLDGRRGEAGSSGETGESELSGGYGYWTRDEETAYDCTAGFTGVTDDGDTLTATAGRCTQGESGPLDGPVALRGFPLAGDPDSDEEDSEEDEEGLLPDDLLDLTSDEDDEGHEAGEDEHDEDTAPGPLGRFLTDTAHVGDGADAALLDVTSSAWDLQPTVSAGAPRDGDQAAMPVYDSIKPIAGAPVCAAGASSGWTCGRVLDAGSDIPVGGSDRVNGFLIDACVLPGDGGGPIMTGHYAVGIGSGTTWNGTDCTDGGAENGLDVAAGFAVSGGEQSLQSLYGDDWRLAVHVGAPTVTAPTDDDVTGRHPTIRGRADAAPGSTVVVTIGGSDPVEAEVGADGRWRAAVRDPLAPGRHSYSATITHTPAGAEEPLISDTVNGSFTVAEVASLVVLTPSAGEQTSNAKPRFAGTGDPGAQITLTFDDQKVSTEVNDDGTWSVEPPDGIRAGRFDATVTQDVAGTIDNVEVEDVGITPGAPLVSAPEEDIDDGYVVTGTGIPGSTVALRIEPEAGDDAAVTETEPATDGHDSGEAELAPADYLAQTDDTGSWQADIGDLPPGTYSITAVQAVDDLTSPRSAATTLEIAHPSRQGMRAAPDDDLVDTGSGSTLMLLTGLTLAVLGGGALLWTRSRRAPLTRS